jgi:hypothetical protein
MERLITGENSRRSGCPVPDIRTREGCRNEFIYPEEMNCREKLKRRAVSVLSDFLVYDITDDEMEMLERDIGYAAAQFIHEATRYTEAARGLMVNYYEIIILYYFRRCLRIADDFLYSDPEEIRPDFFRSLGKAVNELQGDGLLP